ncbi:MAG: hypothetical protein WD023_08080 [Ilumatobacteraceae bacterium]
MSSASPSDLAVTFRSVPRRMRQAQGDVPNELVSSHTRSIQAHLSEASRLLRTGTDPAQIADSIDDVPADSWDESVLSRLRTIALELGADLRAIAAANPDAD